MHWKGKRCVDVLLPLAPSRTVYCIQWELELLPTQLAQTTFEWWEVHLGLSQACKYPLELNWRVRKGVMPCITSLSLYMTEFMSCITSLSPSTQDLKFQTSTTQKECSAPPPPLLVPLHPVVTAYSGLSLEGQMNSLHWGQQAATKQCYPKSLLLVWGKYTSQQDDECAGHAEKQK